MATGSNARPNPRAPDSHEYIAISREWIPTFEANDRITFYLGNPLSSILKILFILSKTLRDLCVLRGDVGIRNIRDIRG